MRHPNPKMLVRLAQGDAYGAAVEYIKLPREEALVDQALKFARYLKHPTHGLQPGEYTDDTQMSIAVTEVLLDAPRYTKEAFAESFVRCFKRDPRKGYAKNFQAFLESVTDGADFLKRIKSTSDKNGAAMRAVPIGVLPTPEEVEAVADLQARITHNTHGGITSAVAVALMSHYALYNEGPLADIRAWLRPRFMPTKMSLQALTDVRWAGGPVTGPDVGWNTAVAVLTLIEEESSLLDIAKRAIRWGGDVDSVLSIAWGIASARMKKPLPPFFDGGLENGAYGYKFLDELGTQLMGAALRATRP